MTPRTPRKRPSKSIKRDAVDSAPSKATAPSSAVPRQPEAPTTEGQRLLMLVPSSLSVIAAEVGASKQVVSCWKLGKKKPAEAARAKLHAKYGIEPGAWVRSPAAAPPTPAPAPRPAAAAPPPKPLKPARPTTLQDCLSLLDTIRDARNAEDLLPSERVRLADAETRALALRARLERDEEFLEQRIVREHPFWKRIYATILAALKPHPAATRDVVEALAAIEAL